MLLYDVSVHPLSERALAHIRRQEFLRAGDRVGAAVSGGIDSVALLRLLLELRGELGIVLSVVHFNHKLRGAESDDDERFVANLACQYDLEFQCDSDDVARHAREQGISVETAARELRYGFFRHFLGAEGTSGAEPPSEIHGPDRSGESAAPPIFIRAGLNKIVTAHTLDDQAETVLMRLIRGAGLKGLGGIYPRIIVEDDHGEPCGEIVRPLLATRRSELETYLKDIGQSWREDATNTDTSFTRNRVRKLLIPMLEKQFNPAVAENIAELAEIARGEEDYWENEIAGWMGTGVHWKQPDWASRALQPSNLVQIGMAGSSSGDGDAQSELRSRIENASWLVMNASVDRMWFLGEPVAVQRRLIKAVGEQAGIPLEFKHVEEILRMAGEETDSGKELSLPLGWKLERQRDELVFVTPDLRARKVSDDYEYVLPVPGILAISEIGSTLEVRRISPLVDAYDAGYNPERLLDAECLPEFLRVRNWRAGDRFWPQHTKSPKKVKDLLQELHVPQPERKLWPVVVSGDEIIWMRGFPPPARFAAKPESDAIMILEHRTGAEI